MFLEMRSIHTNQLYFYYDTIKNRYSVFVPVSWHIAPKTHGIFEMMKDLLMPMRRLVVGTLGRFEMGSDWQGDQGMTRGPGLSASLPQPPGREKGMEIESIIKSQWFNHACIMQPSTKPLSNRAWRGWGWLGRWHAWRGHGSFPHPHLAICTSCCLVVPELYPA